MNGSFRYTGKSHLLFWDSSLGCCRALGSGVCSIAGKLILPCGI